MPVTAKVPPEVRTSFSFPWFLILRSFPLVPLVESRKIPCAPVPLPCKSIESAAAPESSMPEGLMWAIFNVPLFSIILMIIALIVGISLIRSIAEEKGGKNVRE